MWDKLGKVIVIGAGGGGSWYVPKSVMLVGAERHVVIDGDVLEEGNLNRQLFDREDIGKNKAAALAERYGLTHYLDRYFSMAIAPEMNLRPRDVLVSCADNHACRREVLSACDQYGCRCLILGNEYTDAQAEWYERAFRGTQNDPRVNSPQILTDNSGDPLAPGGCTGAAQEKSPQLVLANDMATILALKLFWFHIVERPKFPEDTKDHWPVAYYSNKFGFTVTKHGESK